MRLAKVALLFAFAVLPAVCMATVQKPVISCASAAFSGQGDLVTLTVNGQTLDLEITRANGTRESGRATVETDQYGQVECSVFVSGDGSLAAVVTRIPLGDPESVRVWDVTAARWRSSFELTPRTGLEGRITVLGFWRGGGDLAVESNKLLNGRGTKQADALVLVDAMGSVVAGPRPGESAGALDVERGALWVGAPGSAADCSRRTVDFAGDSVASKDVKTGVPKVPCSCFAGGLHRFAAGLPVGAEGERNNTGTRVWSCLPAGKPQKVSLPSPPKQFADRWVESGPAGIETSPHGDFFAVVLEVTRWSHFDTQRAQWNELHVFQVSPLREVGKIGPIGRCRALKGFAVGDASGKARVAMNWCGKWSVEGISNSKPGLRN